MARLNKRFLLACAAASIACRTDQGVGPYPSRFPPYAPVFTSLEVTPQSADLEQGTTVALAVDALDQRGQPIVPRLVTYSSNNPAIATVTTWGAILGISPGIAEISAAVTLGGSTRTVVMTANIHEAVDSGYVVLRNGHLGWLPAIAHVKAGHAVQWRSDPIVAGTPITWLYFWKPGGPILDSLDIRSGSATRRFDATGTIHYCSGGCWDAPESGVIIVR